MDSFHLIITIITCYFRSACAIINTEEEQQQQQRRQWKREQDVGE